MRRRREKAASFLAVILQGNSIGKLLAADATRVLKRAGEMFGLNMHPNVSDGLVAVDAAAEEAALVAALSLDDVAVKIL